MAGLVVFGTRPDAIKLAPVVAGLNARLGEARPIVVCSGQHRTLIAQTLHSLGLRYDVNFDLMIYDQKPDEVLRRIVASLGQFVDDEGPEWILVQGDTVTALAGALVGHLAHVPVIHLEAGLRTYDLQAPWPEEGIRQSIARLATLHLAPNPRAREHLLSEHIAGERIVVVGNTGLDMQNQITAATGNDGSATGGDPYFLVTLHRRENQGSRLEAVCRRLSALLERFPDHRIKWPRHPNPHVVRVVESRFAENCPRADVVEPLEYPGFIAATATARLAITDSGGVQEEAPSFGVPVAVIRDKTERPEVVELGLAEVAGGDARDLDAVVDHLLERPVDPDAVAQWREIQGDGHAAEAAIEAILARF